MPYRISMSFDMPTLDPEQNPNASFEDRIEFVRKAVDAKENAEEAIAKQDGDFQYDEVEYYSFSNVGPDAATAELQDIGYTWADEEIVRAAMATRSVNVGDFDVQIFLDAEVDDVEQYERCRQELERRISEEDENDPWKYAVKIPAIEMRDGSHIRIDGYGEYRLVPNGPDSSRWAAVLGSERQTKEVPTEVWNVVWELRDLMGH